MKANELRIGNYVKYGNKTFTVLAISSDTILANSNRGEIDFSIKSINAVRLTEDWLIKFGFIIVNFRGIEASKENSRYSVKTVEDYDDFFFCDGEKVLTAFKYVHELQNLYFALTKEELTAKKSKRKCKKT